MMELKQQINAWIDAHTEDIVNTTVRLIQKYSPRGEETADKPFGEAPYEALMEFLAICDEMGFANQNMDNCIGVADLGEGEPQIGILCHLDAGVLSIAIAQGRQLLLCNSYPAQDFTTAEYYIFLAVKSLLINPEMSTVCFMSALSDEEEMSLYRYFKSVLVLEG